MYNLSNCQFLIELSYFKIIIKISKYMWTQNILNKMTINMCVKTPKPSLPEL